MADEEKQVKFFKGRIKSVDPKTNTVEAVITDETKDRYDERVLVTSLRKTKPEFMKHPVLLSSHAYRGLMNQIGAFKKIKIDEENKEVVGTMEYFVGEGNPEADWGFKLAEKGLAAFSIGFIPKKSIRYDDEQMKDNGGIYKDYLEIELLEVSQVLVPANPSALQKSFEDRENKEEEIDPAIETFVDEVVALFKDHQGEIINFEKKEPVYRFLSENISNFTIADGKGTFTVPNFTIPLLEGDTVLLDTNGTSYTLGIESWEYDGNTATIIYKVLSTEEKEIETRKWEETENEIRHRVREPGQFDKFRYITLQKKKPRVNAVVGRVKGTNDWKIQALRFPKADGWTMTSAKEWVKAHPDISKMCEDEEEFVLFFSCEEEGIDFVEFDDVDLALAFEEKEDNDPILLILADLGTTLKQLYDMVSGVVKEVASIKDKKEEKKDQPEPGGEKKEEGEEHHTEAVSNKILDEVLGEEKIAELRVSLFGGEVPSDDKIKEIFGDIMGDLKEKFAVQS